MRTLGNKVSARNLAVSCGAPVMPATPPLPDDPEEIKRLAREIGYPVMLKASWGGGGRGMRPIESEETLLDAVAAARREAKSAFGKDEVYLEKLVRRARHVEVQILGDGHGNLVHLEKPFTFEPLAWAVNKNDPDMLNFMNNYLRQIKGDGSYDRLYKKWFASADWTKQLK